MKKYHILKSCKLGIPGQVVSADAWVVKYLLLAGIVDEDLPPPSVKKIKKGDGA